MEPHFDLRHLGRSPGWEQSPAQIRTPALPADVAFLTRRGLPANIPQLAARLAAARGTQASQELFALGFDPQRYWSMLAEELDLPFAADLDGARLIAHAEFLTMEAVRHATSLLVEIAGETVLILAPGADEIGDLQARLKEKPPTARRLRIAAPETIRSFMVTHRQHVLSHYAVNRLARTLPRLSAKRLGERRRLATPPTLACATLGLLLLSPGHTIHVLLLLLTVLFTNCSFWKLAAALRIAPALRVEPLSSLLLPTYSVLVPLYREAAVVPDLMRHLRLLDYPALCIRSTKPGAA